MNDLLNFITLEYKYDCKLKFLIEKYSLVKIVSEIIELVKIENSDLIEVMTFARDFYIGSDLNEEEKANYYSELNKQNFFQELNKHLYSEKIGISNYAIYTFGKFSNKENSKYLETAYETKFRNENSISSYQCLSELEWLKSVKVKEYKKHLKSEKSLSSKLTLIYLYERWSNEIEIEKILKGKGFQNFINPNSEKIITTESIYQKLWDFENYFYTISTENIKMSDFEKIGRNYFKNLQVE
jgi:hypothetical protein